MSEERDHLLCVLTGKTPEIAGSVTGKCDMCGNAILISPSGREMIRKQNLSPVCIECIRPGEGHRPEQLTEKQVKELMEYMSKKVLRNMAEDRHAL